MLTINDLTYRLGDRLLFDRAGVFLPGRARTGFVGRNGAGKTTLFRLIAGEISPETGSISLPTRTKLGRVEQEAPGGKTSLIDFVLSADVERSSFWPGQKQLQTHMRLLKSKRGWLILTLMRRPREPQQFSMAWVLMR